MVFYECIFIARQDLSNAQVDSITEKYAALVKDHKGKIERQEYCGLRTLSYPIRKNRKGHYVLLDITAEASVMKEVERLMGLNEDILRFLTIRVDAHETGPSALLKASRQRETGRRDFYGDDNEGGDAETPVEVMNEVVEADEGVVS